MDSSYAEVGTEVVIGFGDWCPDYDNIGPMRDLLGTKTTITRVRSFNAVRNPWCHVAADDGRWWWPVCDMILASDIDLLTPEQRVKIR